MDMYTDTDYKVCLFNRDCEEDVLRPYCEHGYCSENNVNPVETCIEDEHCSEFNKDNTVCCFNICSRACYDPSYMNPTEECTTSSDCERANWQFIRCCDPGICSNALSQCAEPEIHHLIDEHTMDHAH